jgi:hypothetical protein
MDSEGETCARSSSSSDEGVKFKHKPVAKPVPDDRPDRLDYKNEGNSDSCSAPSSDSDKEVLGTTSVLLVDDNLILDTGLSTARDRVLPQYKKCFLKA